MGHVGLLWTGMNIYDDLSGHGLEEHSRWVAGLDIRLVDAVARGASRFENLLAPQKSYWPPKN